MAKSMDRIIESARGIQLDQADHDHVEAFVDKIAAKHPTVNTGALFDVAESTTKYYKAVAESGAGMVQDDVDLFRDISMIVTAKFFTGSVIAELASVQPLDNIYGYIYRMTFEYGDDYANNGITAGQSLAAVRSSSFASDPGEQVPARKLKAELRRELVEAKLRPLELSSTFQSLLRRASVLGRDRAAFDNRMLQTAYTKLRDELEVTTLAQIQAIVPANNKVDYTDPLTGSANLPSEKEVEYGMFFDALAEASLRVYNSTGLYPNVAIVGDKGLRLIERHIKQPFQTMNNPVNMMPQRGRLGIFGQRWAIYYDPTMTNKVVLGVFNPDDPNSNPIIYAPYITLAVSPEILDRDLSTAQVVFSVDRVDISEPAFFAMVTILAS